VSPAEPGPTEPGGAEGRSQADRWIALGLIAGAILYALQARTFEAGLLVDPVGPRAFPLVLAFIMAGAAVFLAVRPTGDRPPWPSVQVWRRLGLASAILIAYAYLLEPLGYLIATISVMVALGRLFGGQLGRTTLAATALVVALYFLFGTGLGLYLPALPAL
jgi:putative tricarboxylic transport membrane protein